MIFFVTHTLSLKSKLADVVLKSLTSLFMLLGVPQILQCDNDKERKISVIDDRS
jgi:hypothetical protein